MKNMKVRIPMYFIGLFIMTSGIFFYLPADLIPLAGEGVMQAVSDVTKIEFAKVKIGFDCSMVIVSVITCLLCIHSFGSVGVGTVIVAFLVGFNLGRINKAFGAKRDKLLGKHTYTEEDILRERIDGTK